VTDRQLDTGGTEHDLAELELTVRQERLLKVLRASVDGLSADEAGAVVHSMKLHGGHGEDQRCRWCGKDGKQALEALQRHGLAYRSTGLFWKPTTDKESA
jgi:hypothetical protein